MDEEILKHIKAQEEKLDEVIHAVRRIQRYFFWTLVVTLLVVLLPILGLMYAIPQFLSLYNPAGF